MSHDVITFGCRLNAYESEVIKGALTAAGQEDVVVFNSCAVTEEAERQLRQAIRRTRRERPTAKIIVTGCAAQINPGKYAGMQEVDQVIGNEEKLQQKSYQLTPANDEEKVQVNDIMSVRETALHLVSGWEGKARAFLQVQNGCNHRCTFCIIPYGRGNSRSVPMGDIVAQVRQLVAAGYPEIVLTGVDITDYGKDQPGQPTLGQMMRRLLQLVPELQRLRLSSVDVAEIDPDIFHLIAEEPRFMPHLHISLQAGDNMILKRMKRRHTREDALAFCEKVRALRPDAAFGADIIAGFPTETDVMFDNTLQLVKQADLHYLHVFPYSEREGTPAANMPQVPKQVRKQRAKLLREAGQENLNRYLHTLVGKTVQVLVEKDGEGHTEHFAPVRVQQDVAPGTLMRVEVEGIKEGKLYINK